MGSVQPSANWTRSIVRSGQSSARSDASFSLTRRWTRSTSNIRRRALLSRRTTYLHVLHLRAAVGLAARSRDLSRLVVCLDPLFGLLGDEARTFSTSRSPDASFAMSQVGAKSRHTPTC